MASINVNRNVSDMFYRYKMPPLIAKVEGKGNGIKTVIVNMTEIGRCLSRPPTYLTKYFGCEFGAQTKCDSKNDRFIVNGSHEAVKLQEALDGFIKKFVLCNECNNPETEFHINTKKQIISQSCKACGFVGVIDPHHRLTAFILKNPIEDDDKKIKSSGKKNLKSDTNGSAKSSENTQDEKENEGDIPNFGGLVLDDMKNETNGVVIHKDSNLKNQAVEIDAFEDDWADEKICNVTTKGEETVINDAVDKFYHFVKKLKDTKQIDTNGIDKSIYLEAEKLDLKDKAPIILVEVLLNKDAMNQIPKYRLIFLRFSHQNHRAQKYLLGAFEQLVGKEYPDELMSKIPHLIKALYDADLVEEQTLFEWESKVSKKYVDKETAQLIRNKAAPFIKWLREAESEEDSDGEEDVEKSRIQQNGHVGPKESAKLKVEEDEEYSDDYMEDSAEMEAKLREKHVKRGALLMGDGPLNHEKSSKEGNDSDIDIDAI